MVAAIRPTWSGVVLEVHDGDTITVLCRIAEQPRRVWVEVDGRMHGYNARELAEPGGLEARDHLREQMPVGAQISVTYFGNDKYGGREEIAVLLSDGRDVAAMMIADGYGASWNGRGKKPVPPWPIPVETQNDYALARNPTRS
jgi:endonuclease YncB( thermonuclease family)